jgi:hypothetical protein
VNGVEPRNVVLGAAKKFTSNGTLGKKYNDNTELDNRINDTLLDILQAKTGVSQLPDYGR